MHELESERHDPAYDSTDIPRDQSTQALVDEMGLSVGDWYSVDGRTRKVVAIDDRMPPWDRDSLSVTNPLVDNPQDAEAGTWPTPLAEVYADWRSGDLEPAQVAVSPTGHR